MSNTNGNTPTQGSHFSDGVRVGRVLSGAGNVVLSGDLTDAQKALYSGYRTSSPYGYTKGANGVTITPRYMYIAQPLLQPVNSISLANNGAANSYLTLAPYTASSVVYTTRVLAGVPQVNAIAFDYPQAVSATRVGTTGAPVVSVWGFDYGGVPMYEEITFASAGTSAIGNKAFKSVSYVYVDTADTGWSIGGSLRYGSPYYFADYGFVLGSSFGGVILGNDFFTVGTALTSVSTATTDDVRGIVDLDGAPTPDGVNYLCFNIVVMGAMDDLFLPAGSVVPQTPSGMYGVPQFTRSLK